MTENTLEPNYKKSISTRKLQSEKARARRLEARLKKRRKHWHLITPQGEYKSIINLKLYCSENGLKYSSLLNLSKHKTALGYRKATQAEIKQHNTTTNV